MTNERVVRVEREIAARPETIFELIADPARQPAWDGNDNLDSADAGQRVTGAGQSFVMRNQGGSTRENHVVEFEEGRLIAWKPAEPGGTPIGQLWRWELEPVGGAATQVAHTYDWTGLEDEKRHARARGFTAERLQDSLNRLAELAESDTGSQS